MNEKETRQMISKIAIFRALHLGDMLCIIPTVRAIRASWPGAEIFLIGLPWQRDFARRFNHYFDHFIEFPGWPGLPERKTDPEKIPGFLHEVRTHQFDLVLQMQGNGEITNNLCMLWGARQVCGLRKPGEFAPDEKMFPVSEDSDHEVTRFFKLLNALNIEPQGTDLEFPLADDEVMNGLDYLGRNGLTPHDYVCIHPGARDVRRRWPLEHFAFVANRLTAMDIPVVLTGSGGEATILSQLQRSLRGQVANVVESLGHLSVGELGALICNARLLVSNDTGVSHMAAALKTPSVIIFSPFSDFNRWRPLNRQRNVAISANLATDPIHVFGKVKEMLLKGEHVPRPMRWTSN